MTQKQKKKAPRPPPPTANVRFHHPKIAGDLLVYVNPDQIKWAYGLNVQSYPTYGGEVVQILSVYWDDMGIQGTVSTYAEMENIYRWFIGYMQQATQGRDKPGYDQHPVTFVYEPRGWQFSIWPKSLPGFRYGRDVVAPTWQVVAAVKEPDATFADQIKQYSAQAALKDPELSLFGVATADFGPTADLQNNPWASPDADPTINEKNKLDAFVSKASGQLADTFSAFVQDYSTGNLANLPEFQNVSKAPAYVAQQPDQPTKKSGTVKKK